MILAAEHVDVGDAVGVASRAADAGEDFADPGLAAGPNGFMVLGAGSPAIDRATTDLPVVYDVPGIDDAGLTVDVEGQARPADPAARDVGADERAATAVTNRPLVPTDVICYVCGILRVRFWKFLIGVTLGEGAICALYIYGGDQLLRWLAFK